MLTPDTILQTRYRVVKPLGEGGMGAVYLARDERLGSSVALKETLCDDESLRRAFEHEARLLANLRHAALPKVIDHFIEGQGQFLVMEFIPGEDLMQMLARRGSAFPVEEVLEWADQLLGALEYLHSRQPPVIHRDIKPANIKLTDEGQIVLLDFGLAKGAAWLKSRLMTGKSVAAFTPLYAPPEQMNQAGTDPRSDLFSLGATLYHLVTGAGLIDAMTRAHAITEERPDPLRHANELNPHVSSTVADVLKQAMMLNRERRFSSASAMRKAFRECKQPPKLVREDKITQIILPPIASEFLEQQTLQKAEYATLHQQRNSIHPHVDTIEAGESRTESALAVKVRRFWPILMFALIAWLLIVATYLFYKYYYERQQPPATDQIQQPQPSNADQPATNQNEAAPTAEPTPEGGRPQLKQISPDSSSEKKDSNASKAQDNSNRD
jgi:serine/threonine protein kinase